MKPGAWQAPQLWPKSCPGFLGDAAMRPLSRRNFMQSMGSLLVLPLLRREEPETILYNGNIWTTDEAQPRAQAVAIRGGRLLAVGSNADVLPLATAAPWWPPGFREFHGAASGAGQRSDARSYRWPLRARCRGSPYRFRGRCRDASLSETHSE